jgi:hypothetical protein
MTDMVLILIGVIGVILAGLNLRALGNAVIFSVSVMGRHADMRQLGINSLLYWLGTCLVVFPAIIACWQLSYLLLSLGGLELRLASYFVSTVFLIWGLFNLYVYKVGPRRDSEGRLRKKIVTLSRSSGKIVNDLIFGAFNGISVVFSELGIFLGSVWLIQSTGGFGYLELGFVLLAATSAIWIIFLSSLYGFNLSAVERFRKTHGAKVSFACGVLGVLGSWLILAKSIALI